MQRYDVFREREAIEGEEGGKKLIELGNKGGFSNPRGKCKLSALSSSINFRRRARLVRALEIAIFLY